MSTLIKQIGHEYIYVDDDTVDRLKPWAIVCALLFFIIVAIFYYAVPSSIDKIGQLVGCICAGLMFAVLITCILTILAPRSWKTISAYKVYISGRGSECEVYNPKTTIEVDQIAICKAAKELEPKAKEFDDHEKELEMLAAKCK